jgi:hypothetical protein
MRIKQPCWLPNWASFSNRAVAWCSMLSCRNRSRASPTFAGTLPPPARRGELERHKRITANADGTNRIERHYLVLARDGAVIADFSTDETIRPYTASDLAAFGEAGGLAVESCA